MSSIKAEPFVATRSVLPWLVAKPSDVANDVPHGLSHTAPRQIDHPHREGNVAQECQQSRAMASDASSSMTTPQSTVVPLRDLGKPGHAMRKKSWLRHLEAV